LTAEKKGAPLFEIRALSKVFPSGGEDAGEHRALGDINLDIFPGECLLIAGSNGSGKTLLMKLLAGLLDPSAGEIRFEGRPLAQSLKKLRASLGLIFQDADAQLIGETVEEDIAFGPGNLGLGRGEIKARVEAALDAVGLREKRTAPPRRLSGGEKRRLAVAGVIAMGCQTVIMDEPFANLDWPGVVQALEILRRLKDSGKTVLVLTHELEKVLAYADRLVILHRGQIREDGRPEAILPRLKEEYGVRTPLRSYGRIEDCTWLA
jgi:biotin transport system ATP-binding protein